MKGEGNKYKTSLKEGRRVFMSSDGSVLEKTRELELRTEKIKDTMGSKVR